VNVFLGNGQGLLVQLSGSASFQSNTNPSVTLCLTNLLHMPPLNKNLVSVSRFARDNCVYFEFHPFVCFVKSQVDDSILLKGSLSSDGLYQFLLPLLPYIVPASPCLSLVAPSTTSSSSPSSRTESSSPTSSSSASSTITNQKLSLYSKWHNRLGHPSLTILNHVLKACNVSSINKTSVDFCVACCMGKSHQFSTSPSSTLYTLPLQLILYDLWGPSHVTSSLGYSYYVSFVDAHSCYTWIYFLKSKSNTLHIFKQFQSMAELQLNQKIKEVQTDWGGEFRPFTPFLNSLGIHHRFICPIHIIKMALLNANIVTLLIWDSLSSHKLPSH